VVDELNQTHGLRLVLRQRCNGGLQGGAWMLAEPTGRPVVLKWSRNGPTARPHRLVDTIARIRAAGYPTPGWLASGTTTAGLSYHVQDFVTGQPSTPLTVGKTRLLLEVLERQAGLDPEPARDWSPYVTSIALEDPDDGPRPVLWNLGPPGRDLIAHYDRLLATFGPIQLPTGDMVHGDFNSCNIMLHEDRVSGVIDVEALGSGTRVIDYAWLLREAYVEDYGPEVTHLIRWAGEAVAGPGALALCVAATAFDIVRFKLRHEPSRLAEILTRLHELADDLAKPLPRRQRPLSRRSR
jgi:hypothetical protein